MAEQKNQEKKKKSGLFKILFKIITLGGLLLIVFKYFQKQGKGTEDKENNK